jgi:hypothetical protein
MHAYILTDVYIYIYTYVYIYIYICTYIYIYIYIYRSLGVILYQLLSLRNPFTDSNPLQTARKIGVLPVLVPKYLLTGTKVLAYWYKSTNTEKLLSLRNPLTDSFTDSNLLQNHPQSAANRPQDSRG